MLKSGIANAAIIAGLLFFVLTFLEVFLSEPQKMWVSDRFLSLWLWLSEAKKQSLLDWFRKRHRYIASLAVLLAGAYAVWAFQRAVIPSPEVSAIIFAAVTIGIVFWLGLKIIRLTLHATSLLSAFLRASFFVIIAVMPLTLVSITVLEFKDILMSMAASYANSVATGGPATLKTLGVALSMLLFLLSYVFSIHFMVLTLIFWIAVAIPMFVIYGISGLLVIAEFAVRRIAEYPKGPILAISALVFAVGALLKALS